MHIMKRTKLITVLLALAIAGTSAVWAQDAKPKAAPTPQPSPKASVMQRVGVDTDITVNYNRPGVKGRKIWGDLVPYGLAPANQ